MSQPRRIVILQARAENGGTQEVSRQLAEGFRRRGHDVHEIFFFVRPGSVFRGDDRTIQCLPAPPHNLRTRIALFRNMVAAVRRLQPDVILPMQWDATLLAPLVARCAGGVPVIGNEFTAPAMMPGWVRRIDRWQGTLGCFKRIVTNTRMMMAEYENYPPRYRKRLSLIEHGIQPRRSALPCPAARAAFGLPADGLLLGSLGRLDPQKNYAAAVRILKDQPNWHLAIAGQGKERDHLLALARDAGAVERLHLVGELAPERLGDFLAALDIFVFPTLSESFGLAAVEAAGVGLPVIANDIPVMREVLSVGKEDCALFVETGDTALFAAAVARLAGDDGLRAALSAWGAKLAERYSVDTACAAYDRLIGEIT